MRFGKNFILGRNNHSALVEQQTHMKKQHGRTMTEMLAVLAIMGVLSVVGLMGYQVAMQMWRENETHDQIRKTVMGAKTALLSNRYNKEPDNPKYTDGIPGYYEPVVVNIRDVISDVTFNTIQDKNVNYESFTTPTNVPVWVQMERPYAFSVRMTGVNAAMCEQIVGMDVEYAYAYVVEDPQLATDSGAMMKDLTMAYPYADTVYNKEKQKELCAIFGSGRPAVQDAGEGIKTVDEKIGAFPTLVLWFYDGSDTGKECETDSDCDQICNKCFANKCVAKDTIDNLPEECGRKPISVTPSKGCIQNSDCDEPCEECVANVCKRKNPLPDGCTLSSIPGSPVIEDCAPNTITNLLTGRPTQKCCTEMDAANKWVEGSDGADCCRADSPFKLPNTVGGKTDTSTANCCTAFGSEKSVDVAFSDGSCCKNGTGLAYSADTKDFNVMTEGCCTQIEGAFHDGMCCHSVIKGGNVVPTPYPNEMVPNLPDGYNPEIVCPECCAGAGGIYLDKQVVADFGDDDPICCSMQNGKRWNDETNEFDIPDPRCFSCPEPTDTPYCMEEADAEEYDCTEQKNGLVLDETGMKESVFKCKRSKKCKAWGCCPAGGKVIKDTNDSSKYYTRVKEICFIDEAYPQISEPYCTNWLPGYEGEFCLAYSICDQSETDLVEVPAGKLTVESSDKFESESTGVTIKLCPACYGTADLRADRLVPADGMNVCTLDTFQEVKELKDIPEIDGGETDDWKKKPALVVGLVRDCCKQYEDPVLKEICQCYQGGGSWTVTGTCCNGRKEAGIPCGTCGDQPTLNMCGNAYNLAIVCCDMPYPYEKEYHGSCYNMKKDTCGSWANGYDGTCCDYACRINGSMVCCGQQGWGGKLYNPNQIPPLSVDACVWFNGQLEAGVTANGGIPFNSVTSLQELWEPSSSYKAFSPNPNTAWSGLTWIGNNVIVPANEGSVELADGLMEGQSDCCVIVNGEGTGTTCSPPCFAAKGHLHPGVACCSAADGKIVNVNEKKLQPILGNETCCGRDGSSKMLSALALEELLSRHGTTILITKDCCEAQGGSYSTTGKIVNVTGNEIGVSVDIGQCCKNNVDLNTGEPTEACCKLACQELIKSDPSLKCEWRSYPCDATSSEMGCYVMKRIGEAGQVEDGWCPYDKKGNIEHFVPKDDEYNEGGGQIMRPDGF